jgi:hypothetical protein
MGSLVFFAVLLAVSIASASVTPEHQGRKGFSLEAAKKSNSKPDFVREWVAAHQKWGKGVSPETLSAFSLLDDGMGLAIFRISLGILITLQMVVSM